MDHPWAKFESEDEWHPLVAHSADVAAVLEMLIRHTSLGTRMAHLMGQDHLTEVQIQRFCVLAVLHDAGKANQGFQNRAFDREPSDNHVTPMVGMLATNEKRRTLTERLGLRDLLPWFSDDWGSMFSWLHTTWSHHGSPVPKEAPKRGRWPEGALDRLSMFYQWTRQWYPQAFDNAPTFASPELQHLFNGALTLADWIGSDTTFFKLSPNLTAPYKAIDTARCRAKEALEDLGLTLNRDIDSSLPTILGGYEPYEVQEMVQALPTHVEGTLSVLESATGSGKTEGAIGRYAHLLEEGLVDSMFFAVPTRAAAKQLQGRIKEARDRIFGAKEPPVHLAVPGYLQVDDVEGTRLGWQVRWDDEVGPRGWAAESSKRYTASPIAVGTIDQVLMSVLQIKHAHLRLAGLSRSFLVVDEVHASSAYMNELLQEVLWFHQRMGGHALLMSATLGSRARAAFTGEETLSLDEAKQQRYPLLSHVNGPEVIEPKKPDAPEGENKDVTLRLKDIMEDPDAIARCAEKAAAEGAHVLVIRNTVKACQRLFEEIDESYSLRIETDSREIPTPHHSRYCADDRECLDAEIERIYGKNEVNGVPTRNHEGGIITVATQTVEQSLDIDADLLITDLCPMDVLLQRIGRLHRHNRDGRRPEGYQKAQGVVLAPEDQNLKESISADSGKGFPGPGLGSVYSDLRIINATWDALKKRTKQTERIVIPRDNRTLVEEATHPDVLASIQHSDARWEAHTRYLKEEKREEMLGAKNARIDRDEWFTSDDNQFPKKRPKTRLGEEDIVVALDPEMTTPFGNTVEELTLAPHLFDSDHRPENGSAEATPTSDGFTFTFAGKHFTYTALGIQTA
jgi:CRISPR-associated endonuclease/helicase Cas3